MFKQQPVTAVEREQQSGHVVPKQPPIAQDWTGTIDWLLHRWAIYQQRSVIGQSCKSVKCTQQWHPEAISSLHHPKNFEHFITRTEKFRKSFLLFYVINFQ